MGTIWSGRELSSAKDVVLGFIDSGDVSAVLHWEMLNRGIFYASRGMYVVSTPMDEARAYFPLAVFPDAASSLDELFALAGETTGMTIRDELRVTSLGRVPDDQLQTEVERTLAAAGLTKSYRGRRVVDDVGLLVRRGEAVGLLGPALFYPVSFTLWQAVDLWMRRPTEAELAGIADATL